MKIIVVTCHLGPEFQQYCIRYKREFVITKFDCICFFAGIWSSRGRPKGEIPKQFGTTKRPQLQRGKLEKKTYKGVSINDVTQFLTPPPPIITHFVTKTLVLSSQIYWTPPPWRHLWSTLNLLRIPHICYYIFQSSLITEDYDCLYWERKKPYQFQWLTYPHVIKGFIFITNKGPYLYCSTIVFIKRFG